MLHASTQARTRARIGCTQNSRRRKTDWVGDTSTNLTSGSVVPIDSSTSLAFLTYLRNPDTGAGFWIVRQNDSVSNAISSFKLNVTTSSGMVHQIPEVASSITLAGRQSKVIVTDYRFGQSRALYSTAQVFFAGIIDGRDVLFLYGDSTQEHEVALQLTGAPNELRINESESPYIHMSLTSSATETSSNVTVFSILAGFEGFIPLYDSDTQLVLFADTETAKSFWSPPITPSSSDDPFANYWSIGTNESILVGGPYLVRSASFISTPAGVELALKGDLNVTEGAGGVMLTLIAPKNVTSLSWNGEGVALAAENDNGSSSTISALRSFKKVSYARNTIQVPDLDKLDWKFNDSLPEIQGWFDDSSWTLANHTTTNIPFPMYYGDGRVLYGCDYGFCENVVLWRGHFMGSGSEKSANLSINGGVAFAASVWLNDVFLNTSFGNSSNNHNQIEETDEVFTFPSDAILVGQDNVITIVQDNMGLNETDNTNNDPKSPRGVRGFKLNSGNFTEWRVQGKLGGYKHYLDKTRGILNEGGLYGERRGWHLPGFDVSSWASRALSSGLPDSKAGVAFFVTTFNLDIPRGYDVPMSFVFTEGLGQPYRAYMFVNGWMMGKRVANLGPQAKFPVHEGILNYQGTNTIAIALWAMVPDVKVAPHLQLVVDGTFEGGVKVTTNNPVWSPDGREGS